MADPGTQPKPQRLRNQPFQVINNEMDCVNKPETLGYLTLCLMLNTDR